MRIAVAGPIEIPFPVKDYGGIELIAQDLTEALISMGHTVDLYGRGQAKKYPISDEYDAYFDFTHLTVKEIANRKGYFRTVFLTDVPDQRFNIYPSYAVKERIGISGTVIYPGIKNVYREGEDHGYLLFLGRIHPIKGVHVAISVARIAGIRLVIAGHTGSFADPMYVEMIRSAVRNDQLIQMVENPSRNRKVELLSHAHAVIIPSNWSSLGVAESFGLTAVEALMSGKPVITSGDGGLSEIVTPQVGFVCRTLDEYLQAVKSIDTIDKKEIRKRAEYFTIQRMARDYIDLVEKSLK